MAAGSGSVTPPRPGRRSLDKSTTRVPASTARATHDADAPCGSAANTSAAAARSTDSVATSGTSCTRPPARTRNRCPACECAVAKASDSRGCPSTSATSSRPL